MAKLIVCVFLAILCAAQAQVAFQGQSGKGEERQPPKEKKAPSRAAPPRPTPPSPVDKKVRERPFKCDNERLTDEQFYRCILKEIGGVDPDMVEHPSDCEVEVSPEGFAPKGEGEVCSDAIGKLPSRDTSKYYQRIEGTGPLKPSIQSLYCSSESDCTCNDQCIYYRCYGGCDHGFTFGEARIDGGGNCTTSECYSFFGKMYEDFDSDGRPEYGHGNKNDLDTGACKFQNICGFEGETKTSPTTGKMNIMVIPNPTSEARLMKKGSWKYPEFDVYGNCVDRVGDPMVQGCYITSDGGSCGDGGWCGCPSGFFNSGIRNVDGTDYGWCYGDFTCVRQMGAWFLSGDYIYGDRKQPAEVTSCETSADCCGSWARSYMFPPALHSNVPVTCIEYSYISSPHERLKNTLKPYSGNKVCWNYGGASEIYLTNGIIHYPHTVDLIDKHFSKQRLPPFDALEEELCNIDGGYGRRLKEKDAEERKLEYYDCINPCTGSYDRTLDDATCNCFDGVNKEKPEVWDKNTQGKTLGECLRLCWQNHVTNRFSIDAAAETCDNNCVLNCSTYRFDTPTPPPTPYPKP